MLIVDDEQALLEQAEVFLKKKKDGLEIETTISAEDALEMLEERDYDIIVADYQMPEINGLEFLKILRDEKDNEVPFIMFTGKGREKVAMKALNLGADRYLQKGGDPDTQYGVLAQAIEQEANHHITRKRRDELAKDLEVTFNAIEHPIFLLDKEHRILRTNHEAEKFFGEYEEKLLGEYCHKIAHGQDEPIENCPLEKTKDSQESEELAFYHEELDKQFIARTNPVMDEEGNIKKIIHQEIDVTEIKEKNAELKKTKDMFESLFHDPYSFMGILDTDGTIFKANESSLELIGEDLEEVQGKRFWKTSWWEHSERLQEKLKEGIKRAVVDEIVRFEADHEGKEGETVEVDFFLRPVKNDDDEVFRLIAEGKGLYD